MVSQQFTCCICLPKDQRVKKLSAKARAPTKGPESQEVISKGQSAYRRTRESRSYQQRPERLPKDQRVKELSTKARVPTKGPKRQGIIITLSSYKTREGGDKKELEGCTTRNNVRQDVSTVRLLHIPTEGPERQKRYQQSQSAKTGIEQQKNRQDGNHTRIGCSYAMAVPMNISSHREVGDLEKGERDALSEKPELQEADHKTTYDKTTMTPNAR